MVKRLCLLVVLAVGQAVAGGQAAQDPKVSEGQAEAQPPRLSYVLKVDPAKRQVAVQGTLEGAGAAEVRRFSAPGLRRKLELRLSTAQDKLVFDYALPEVQSEFENVGLPALEKDFFAGFGDRLLIVPQAKDIGRCKDVRLRLELPEAWRVATSLGHGAREFACPSVGDLMGTLVCAGDYAVHTFDVAHRDASQRTTVLVALRGERQIDEARLVRDLQRLVEGQMAFFGGSHPAPRQFLALHFIPPQRRVNVPAFNRRAPGHDTVLAFHSSSRPQDDFEFLGMLAHEHLHNWYPTVMRSSLGPWFMEGLNDYVAYRGLYVSGVHNAAQFTGMLSKWHREYHWCLRNPRHPLMPYRRGMLAGWVFDIELRRSSGGKHGLRDVLLGLLENRPESGVVGRTEFLAMMQRRTGKDMAPLYEELVERAEPIPLARFLEGTGFRLADDKVGIRIDPADEPQKAFLQRLLSDE